MDESLVQRAIDSKDPSAGEQALREFDAAIQQSSGPIEKANLLLGKASLCGVFFWFAKSKEAIRDAKAIAPDDLDLQLSADYIDGALCDQEARPDDAYVKLTSVLHRYSHRLSLPDFRFMYEDIQLRRGLDATSTGRFTEALPILKECDSFVLKPAQKSIVLADLGRCYFEAGENESARDSFTQSLRSGLLGALDEGQAHLYLAIVCARLSLFEEAKDEFTLCAERATQYGVEAGEVSKVYRWLAWVCRALGERSESERYASLGRHPS